MVRFHGRRRAISIVVGVVFAALLAMPSMASAAQAKIVFGDGYDGLRLGDSCVSGGAPRAVPLHLVWKSAAGVLKANAYLATTDYRTWGYCSGNGATLAAGDVLKATVGSYTRKFVVPLVTIRVDRVNDNFHGKAPAGSAVTLWYVYSGCCPDYEQHEDLTADSDGNWFFSDGYPVDGYQAHVEWHSAKGDSLVDRDIAPSVMVTIGSSLVAGDSHPRAGSARIVLRDGTTNARKGVAVAPVEPGYGQFSGVLLDDAGQPVKVNAGDRVVGSTLASDMHFIVKDIEASADVVTDVVSGKCGYRGGGEITVSRNGRWLGRAFMGTDRHGNFSVWFGDEEGLGYDPANIRHGDRLTVRCAVPTGDWIRKSFIVP